jgi:HAD superfamily hydrolase (TIGR01549 family)
MRRALRALVFDMDGTLTLPGAIDFSAMRSRIGAPPGVDILTHVDAAPTDDERRLRAAAVADEEARGLERVALMPDISSIVDFTAARPSLRVGLITRNNAAAASHTMSLLQAVGARFDHSLSREWSGGPPKPHPAGLLYMIQDWEVNVEETVMVGDSIDDVLCGKAAGATSVLIGSIHEPDAKKVAHFHVQTLTELVDLLHKEFDTSI